MYFVYSVLFGIALLASAPYWLLRLVRQGKYREGLRQRLGMLPPQVRALAASGKPVIWIHAVSVGEILAMAGLIGRMRERFAGYTVAISTTTSTGYKLAGERFGPENVFYFPLDFRFAVNRYMRLLRPRLVVIAETEFWPNFLRAARVSGARIAVVNARISDRSFPRYRFFRFLLRPVLRNVDLFLAQSEQDAQRLLAVGAEERRVHTVGNLKFDAAAPAATSKVEQLRAVLCQSQAGPIAVFGSTVEGEEAMLLGTFRELLRCHARAVIMLAPRHKERFAEVAELIRASGIPFTRRSDPDWPRNVVPGIVLLLDTIGELAAIYSLADVAFVGGSLAPRGGHNILEPASFAVPILVGPHTENFRDIVRRFESGDGVAAKTATNSPPVQANSTAVPDSGVVNRASNAGVVVVADATELRTALLALLNDPTERRRIGGNAQRILRANQGATERTLSRLEELLAGRPH